MKLLFVCMGNTCRSPMAEGYLAAKGIPWLEVQSRGIYADNSPVSANAAAVMAEIGVDISSHRSTQLTKADIAWADRIVCLNDSLMVQLLSSGVTYKKVSVLGFGINDPYGGDLAVYRECRDEIVRAIDQWFEAGFFSDFSIIPMEERHIGGVAKLEKVCFSSPWSADAILESVRHGSIFFVAENADHIMGYIGFRGVAGEGYVQNVAVFPKYRRLGVATALIRKAIGFAKENGWEFLSLEVRKSNEAAIALYTQEGFQKEGERRNFYTNPKEDAWILTVQFPKKHENTEY